MRSLQGLDRGPRAQGIHALSAPLDLTGHHVFITGGTGFIGRTLLDYLAESVAVHGPGVGVCVLSRDPARFSADFPQYVGLPWLRLVKGDVCTLAVDPQGAGIRCTDFIHAAADAHASAEPLQWLDQIVVGTRNALDFALVAGARRFLNLSSGAVYGAQPNHIDALSEGDCGAPPTESISSVYGQSKRMAEQLCTVYRHLHGMATVNARCFAIVSEHVPLDGPYAIGNFIRDALRAEEITVLGSGKAVRTYLYGRDVAHWLFTLLLKGAAGESYNVGSDVPVTIAELASRVAQAIAPGKRMVCASAEDDGERFRYVPNVAKARGLGLEVETNLDEAIIRCAAHFRRSLEP